MDSHVLSLRYLMHNNQRSIACWHLKPEGSSEKFGLTWGATEFK